MTKQKRRLSKREKKNFIITIQKRELAGTQAGLIGGAAKSA